MAVEKGVMSGMPPNPDPSELSVRWKRCLFIHNFMYSDIYCVYSREIKPCDVVMWSKEAGSCEHKHVLAQLTPLLKTRCLRQHLRFQVLFGMSPELIFCHKRVMKDQIAVQLLAQVRQWWISSAPGWLSVYLQPLR